MMTLEKMMDAVIYKFGFESPYAIWFCALASAFGEPTEKLKKVFSDLMAKNIYMTE